MTYQPRHQGALWHRIFPLLAVVLHVVGWATHSGPVAAQAVVGPNIIVTSDAPGVVQHGAFQHIHSNMSRSQRPLGSLGAGTHSVTFATAIAQPGYYRVFVWWPPIYGTPGNADVTVSHLQGNSTVTVNQGFLTGQWVSIGIYPFDTTGAQINLLGRSGATLLADAVRLQYMGPQMPPLAFETDALPVGVTGEQYAAQFDVIAGTAPFRFDVDPSSLPRGLALDAEKGTLSGIPTAIGTYQLNMQVFDHAGQQAVQTYTLEVVRGSAASSKSLGSVKSFGSVKRLTTITPKDGVAAGTPPDLSNLINLLAALPEGEWLLANLNAYSDVWTPADLRPLEGARNPDPSKIIVPWSSFAWDPNRGDLWLYGGGHNNYPGNDVYRWRGTTQMWERASLPSEIKQDDLGFWEAVDGWDAAPTSAHTYDNNMFFPHVDRLIVFGGAAFDSGGPYRREVTPTTNRITGPFLFDPSRADPNEVGGTTGSQVMRVAPHPEIVGGNMWANRDIYVNIPSHPTPLSHVDGCTAYADENGRDVAYVGARIPGSTAINLYKYTLNDLSNPGLDTLVQVGQWWSGTQIQNACAIDPVRQLLVRTGDKTTAPFSYWNLATPGTKNRDVAFTPVDPTGEFGSLVANGQINLTYCGFDFDPIGSQFLLWCGDGRVWVLTPPTPVSPNGWTIVKQPSPQLATPNGDVGTGLLGKWKYISNLDAFMGLQDATLGNIWIYKPIGWVNPLGAATISPPTGVAASDGTSTTSVTISWNASAGATSYTIYRSANSGSQGAAIGTSSTTSFTDATPAPGTTYYYGVTAAGPDGVSALSAQDSGYAAVSGTGGLSATATLSSVVNLTAIGTSDWVHWLPLNRKAAGGFISDYVPVGNATIARYSDDPRSFVWTDGIPNATGNDSAGAAMSGIGAGFSFSVAADTTTRTLLIYVGGSDSSGTLTAHLSDFSAPDLADVPLSESGRYDGFYTLIFKAGSAGQQLEITWTQTAGPGSITLQGAALQ
jgi:putative Ig domain-containing protein